MTLFLGEFALLCVIELFHAVNKIICRTEGSLEIHIAEMYLQVDKFAVYHNIQLSYLTAGVLLRHIFQICIYLTSLKLSANNIDLHNSPSCFMQPQTALFKFSTVSLLTCS